MPTDPIRLPLSTDSRGVLALDVVHPGLQKRHWWHVEAITIDTTVDDDSEFLTVDASGSGDITISLPDASVSAGQAVIIHCGDIVSGNSVIIDPLVTGDTVNSTSTLTLTAAGGFVHLISDGGTDWLLYIDGR